MKASHLIPLCATTVFAKDPITHFGVSRPQTLLGLSENPLCLTEVPTVEDLGEEQRQLADSLWPESRPCARNGTNEYCVFSNPSFAGRGITIFTSPARAATMAKSKAFTDPSIFGTLGDLNAAESPRWRVEAVQGKGMGLIAAKKLEMGDHIMSVTASIMIDYDIFGDVTEDELQRMQVHGVGYLPPEHRAILLNLSTHDEFDSYETQVSKVIMTNAFDIQDKDLTGEGESENFYTVFPEISRMNHDCRPNADYHFDPATYSQHIHAVRPIEAGEEITISYINPILTRKIRLERLNHSWHFPCSCSLCTQNHHQTQESDARIRQIKDARRQLRDWEPTSQASVSLAELLVSLYKQERLWSIIYEAYTYAAIEYNGAGESWTALKYARLAIQHGLASAGPLDSDVIEMQSLVESPWDHWSYMLRTKRRMNWGTSDEEEEDE